MLEIYRRKIIRLNEILQRNKAKRNLVTAGKIILFLAVVWGIWQAVSRGENVYIWLSLLFIAGFIALNIADTRLVRRLTLLRALLKGVHTEIAFLEGDLGALDPGDEYKNPAHPYASDLDIFGGDSLFQAINRCHTPNGKDLLAAWLGTPLTDGEAIKARQEAAAELAADPDWCFLFRANADAFGVSRKDDAVIREWQREQPAFRRKTARPLVYAGNIVTIGSVLAALFGLVSWGVPLMAFFLQILAVFVLSKTIGKQSARSSQAVKALINYLNLVLLIDRKEFSAGMNRELKEELIGEKSILKAFRELSGIVDALDQRANVLALLIFNGLFMRDLHTVLRLDRWKMRYAGELDRWTDRISHFDVLVSMANFRINRREFIVPEIREDILISSTGIAHPLLGNGVRNDFEIRSLREFYIVTGANMSGKSTFLRAVGVNLVLALSGNVVCAETFRFQPVTLYTSMRTTDNLSKGTSYFHAELLRLKGIIDLSRHTDRLFVIIDEMLKGTNSHDKLNGSRLFLQKLLQYDISGIIATHDLELGELEQAQPGHFRNACFEIAHEGERVIYDYKLRPGVSRNMNASILLRQMGLV